MLKMEPPGKRRGARPLRRFMNAAQGRHEEAGGAGRGGFRGQDGIEA